MLAITGGSSASRTPVAEKRNCRRRLRAGPTGELRAQARHDVCAFALNAN